MSKRKTELQKSPHKINITHNYAVAKLDENAVRMAEALAKAVIANSQAIETICKTMGLSAGPDIEANALCAKSGAVMKIQDAVIGVSPTHERNTAK